MRLLLSLAILIAYFYVTYSAPIPRTCERHKIDDCRKKIPANNTVPKCNETKSEAEVCFAELSDICPDDLEIEHYIEKFKLIQKAMCKTAKSGGSGQRFEKNPKCWAKTDACLDKLVTPNRLLPGKVCEAKKRANDQCKVSEEVHWECKEIHAIFLEHAFQESQCGACGLKFNLFVLILTVITFFHKHNF